MTWLLGLLTGKAGPWIIGAVVCVVLFGWAKYERWQKHEAQKQVLALKGTIMGLEAKIKVNTEFMKLDREAQGEVKKIEADAQKWLCDYFAKCPVPGGVRKPGVPKAPDVRPAAPNRAPPN